MKWILKKNTIMTRIKRLLYYLGVRDWFYWETVHATSEDLWVFKFRRDKISNTIQQWDYESKKWVIYKPTNN